MAEGKEDLVNVFYETSMVQDILRPMLDEAKKETPVSFATLANINMLMGIIARKLEYYDKKYGFEIDYEDVFYPEDIANFLRFETKGNGQKETKEGGADD